MELQVGQSQKENAEEAVKEAAKSINIDDPELVYVFASYAYEMKEVVEKVKEKYGNSEVVGCSSAVEVTSDGVKTESLAIGAVNNISVGVGVGKNIDEDSYKAGNSAIKQAAEKTDFIETREDGIEIDPLKKQSTIVNIFSDPLNGVGIEVLEAVNDYLGEGFKTAGQFAADNLEFEETFVAYNDEVYNNAVVAVIYDTEENVGLNKAHGFQKMQQSFNVQEADKNIVKSLGGRKPAEVYADLFGEEKSEDPGFLLMTPFGMDVGGDEPEIRVTISVDNGCYVCGASVPEDENITLLRGDKQKLLEAAETASSKAVESGGLKKEQTEAALIFSCVGRHAIYNDEELTEEEVQNVMSKLDDETEVIGLYGFGQIAQTTGKARFNEETMVVQVVGKDENEL